MGKEEYGKTALSCSTVKSDPASPSRFSIARILVLTFCIDWTCARSWQSVRSRFRPIRSGPGQRSVLF